MSKRGNTSNSTVFLNFSITWRLNLYTTDQVNIISCFDNDRIIKSNTPNLNKKIVHWPLFSGLHLNFFIENLSENPKKYMIDLLEKLQRSRATKHDYPCLFDDTNIQSVYNMLDPTNRGFITMQQYKEGIYRLLWWLHWGLWTILGVICHIYRVIYIKFHIN